MRVFLGGKVIVSPWMFLVILLFLVLGYTVVHIIANRKWGYTPNREKDPEQTDN